MKLIAVAGTSSNVGKTTICEVLIRYLTNYKNSKSLPLYKHVSALKITTRHQGVCSQGDCGVCDSIKYPYVIEDNDFVINQTGKDTSRLKDAGTEKVIWLLSFPETLKEGVTSALSYFGDDEIVIIEGNSFLSVHNADLSILVTRPLHMELKKSASVILDKIDLTLINKENSTLPLHIKDTQKWLDKIGSKSPVIDIDPCIDESTLFQNDLFKSILDRLHLDN